MVFRKKFDDLARLLLLVIIWGQMGAVQGLTNVTDLSYELNAQSECARGSATFKHIKRTVGASPDGSWIAYNEFCTSELCGTYMNAPFHLYKYGLKIDNIPLSSLILPALIVDISYEVSVTGPDTHLTADHLQKWQGYNTPLPDKFILLVRFGWSQFYGLKRFYAGSDSTHPRHPGLSVDACQWIVESRKIVGVGVDVPSITPGHLRLNFSTHRVLAQHQIYGILNLNMTKQMPSSGVTLLVMPLKISSGSGSPVRVVAISTRTRYDLIRGLESAEYEEMIQWYGEMMLVVCLFTLFLIFLCTGVIEYMMGT